MRSMGVCVCVATPREFRPGLREHAFCYSLRLFKGFLFPPRVFPLLKRINIQTQPHTYTHAHAQAGIPHLDGVRNKVSHVARVSLELLVADFNEHRGWGRSRGRAHDAQRHHCKPCGMQQKSHCWLANHLNHTQTQTARREKIINRVRKG